MRRILTNFWSATIYALYQTDSAFRGTDPNTAIPPPSPPPPSSLSSESPPGQFPASAPPSRPAGRRRALFWLSA